MRRKSAQQKLRDTGCGWSVHDKAGRRDPRHAASRKAPNPARACPEVGTGELHYHGQRPKPSSANAKYERDCRCDFKPDQVEWIESGTIICGLAVGYLDPDFPGNKLHVGREPIAKDVVFLDS
jgi:hypothetical protein